MATSKKASKQEEVAAGEAKPTPKKKRLLLAVAAVVLVGALGGAAAWYFLKPAPGAEEEAASKPVAPKPPVFSALEPFVVNLQPEMGEQYLQVAMTLQVAEQAQADQIKLYMPMIRSRMLTLLSSKRPSELTTPEGKTKLAEEIMTVLNEPFAQGASSLGVSSVFFTAFVIQ